MQEADIFREELRIKVEKARSTYIEALNAQARLFDFLLSCGFHDLTTYKPTTLDAWTLNDVITSHIESGDFDLYEVLNEFAEAFVADHKEG